MLSKSFAPSYAVLATSLLIGLAGMCQAAAPNVMDSAMGGLSAPCAGNALKSLQSNPKLSNCLNLLGLVQLATLSQDESALPPLQVRIVRGVFMRILPDDYACARRTTFAASTRSHLVSRQTSWA